MFGEDKDEEVSPALLMGGKNVGKRISLHKPTRPHLPLFCTIDQRFFG